MNIEYGVSICRINSSSDNAREMVELRQKDLLRAGHDLSYIECVSKPNNQVHIEKQRQALEQNPERFLGVLAIRHSKLIGFIEIQEWTREDDYVFNNSFEKLATAALISIGHKKYERQPVGIKELVVDSEILNCDNENQPQFDVVSILLEKALDIAEAKEVNVVPYMDTVIVPTLYRHGFEPTGRFNNDLGVTRQLIKRPAYIRNKIGEHLRFDFMFSKG